MGQITSAGIAQQLADEMRQKNLPPGYSHTAKPDVAWREAPPGKTVDAMTLEQQEATLIAVEGLAAHLRGQIDRMQAGTPAYQHLGRMLGTLTVTAGQIRRWIDAAYAAAGEGTTAPDGAAGP